MSHTEILPVNFTVSREANRAIAQVRRDYDAQFPDDPAAVLWVAWGLYRDEAGSAFESVLISFYPHSMLPEVEAGIQEVSGLKLVFFVTEEHHHKFERKVLDHAEESGFFLRDA